ncbi:uncharacterized protein PHALS_12603 [Plasmopara halstedii]|uniref:Uncharacterized protein n=1 Tax=Plasmopara halstedii TaxID=4781 RepID=A0A0P1ALN1_PLAHL|nr:uncharacterized protein PHALS_12603 [Plasmopara halstedii]CEG42321.1 hypothetical protein PHALS_12603 [Plasmopara halstedii]|eukprot:XP_024578690.1 hypothetical protein PHALS_12603 [Plasmopara halstedii]
MTPPATTGRPAHALCLTKHRSYTSPHMMLPCSKIRTYRNDHALSAVAHNKPVAAHLICKTQSINKGLEPFSWERLANFDVFLGGSCNPTTWRHDIAIPMLDAARVNYFNPQVDEWYEELIHIEAKAKEMAQIVLMVIDGLTRSIVCINEAVEYICRGRKVILVVEDIKDDTEIAGTFLSKTELADLNGARQFLRDLASKRGVSLFLDVATAIQGCIKWLSRTDMLMSRSEMSRLRKRSSIVLNDCCGRHRSYRGALRSLSPMLLKSYNLDSSTSSTDGSENSDLFGESSSTRSITAQLGCSDLTDSFVYLGGTLSSTSWRKEVAIPLQQKAGISLYVPYADYSQFGLTTAEMHVQAMTEHLQEVESLKAMAELILFVIPKKLRSIAAMTEAVELVSSHHAMILVIEPVKEGCMVEEGVTISGREFQDLARARAYLQETAERNHIAVFESVSAAVENIVETLV